MEEDDDDDELKRYAETHRPSQEVFLTVRLQPKLNYIDKC